MGRTGRLRRWTGFIGVGALLLLAAAWAGGRVAATQAARALEHQAAVAAALHEAVLRSELEKHRSLPYVLAEDPDVRRVLRGGGDTAAEDLSRKLEALSGRTRAAVIYLLDERGVAVAASNWRLPTSFVGSDYSFRDYFRDGLRLGAAELFALGTVTQRPGLFLARRVDGPAGRRGVVVVKVEFDALEAEWRRSGEPAFVTDPNGVVLVTSLPEWRFRTLRRVSPEEQRRLVSSRQYGKGPLRPLPLAFTGGDAVIAQLPGGAGRQGFVHASTPASSPGWTLHLLASRDPVMASAVTAGRSVALLLAFALLLAAGLLLRRHERSRAEAARREAARADLEARVEARTGELRAANERLVVEMEERRRAEAGVQRLQDDLVQANKLAMLGQIAAGVAHEINQPVAAIRTYSENAVVLLGRGEPKAVGRNLSMIASLTERIGVITDELRAFSRKTKGRPEPLLVEDAIAGALLLVGARMAEHGVRLRREGDSRGVMAYAERIRLEQVLVNLLQNAVEALAGAPRPTVRVAVKASGETVAIIVSDNGPGLDAAAAADLFTPFVSTKPRGLGLGLVISRDIVSEFGGELVSAPSPDGGAAFVVTLRRAA